VRLFDEVTGVVHEFGIRPRMGVYVCGITPYDSAHLGHAFTYVAFDVLIRYLRYLGSEVLHVQNVTDVDDDILRSARERRIDYRELAQREAAAFDRAMRTLGVTAPTETPWASEFIPEMVQEVRGLIAAGHGYVREGMVYFRVSSDPGYGRLSGLSREEMLQLAAERGGHPDDPAKDDPLDFVLWQRSAPDEPSWESPWGPGRPGWHIECSTMARRIIGQPVDLHGGGSDLVFPHHDSELSHAEGLPGGRPFVLQWMHTGSVHQAGEKMSKSLGNLTFVEDLLERHSPAAIRRLLLRHHYREDWSFDESELAHASEIAYVDMTDVHGTRDGFFEALDNDLDTPTALSILDRARASTDADVRRFVEEGDRVLGLDLATGT
jgi:L-cysteine:1D-myo-inositol 2-amino-2-deoxy-alpha-D-glucopyranoside ligase